jgi:hypothetical protein
MKQCKNCKELKPLELFHNDSRNKDGKQNKCRVCTNEQRSQHRKQNAEQHKQAVEAWKKADPEKYYRMLRNSKLKKYGLTIQEYDGLFKSQKGVCKICGETETKGKGKHKETLAVDHCHTTGKVRGLLCSSCNRGLGFFQDKIDNLKKAIEYLDDNRSGY